MSYERQHTIEQFLFHEANLLDSREFRAWLKLFLPTAFYWVPSAYGQNERKGQLSIYDEGIAEMELRINRMTERTAHTENPIRHTCRIVSNVTIESDDGHVIDVRSKLVLHDYRVCDFAVDEARCFPATVYHRLEQGKGQTMNIAWKRVDLVSAAAALPVLSPPF